MGLKNLDGLEPGGLRNLSSLQDAFFDVAITNTNSPINPGDTLVVDYSADNTGGVSDTQDIRLEIDSVQEDSDAGVFLVSGSSTTGTLEWATASDETAQDYTASVVSADDGASQTVTVESASAIPDSVVHRYPDATDTDSAGDADLTTSGTTTATGTQYTDNEALDYDGADDVATASLPTSYSPVSIVIWTIASKSGSNQNDFAKPIQINDGSTASAYIQVSSAGTWEFGIYDGTDRGQIDTGVSVTSGTLYNLALTSDGSTIEAYVDGTSYGTASGVQGTGQNLAIGDNDTPTTGQQYAGVVDEPIISDAVLSQSDISGLDDGHPR